ncbi:MAG: SGNH/GDSL hydrolase family protein [Solirubrobacterales bacterium]
MRRRRPSFFSIAAKTLLVLIVAVLLAEGAASLAHKKVRPDRPVESPVYSDDDIRRLYGTDDPSRYRAVLAESWGLAETMYSPLVEYRMSPVKGKHYTVTEDNYRVNGYLQDIKAPGLKVFVFGGSTTLGMGAADTETIPAYLEEQIRAEGKQAQVFNFGTTGWTSTQERIALERFLTTGVVPDVAVFIDGLDDFAACTLPDVSAWNERLTQLTRARAHVPLAVEVANRSNVVQLVRQVASREAAAPVPGAGRLCASDEDVTRIARRLDTNRRLIAAAADRLGFKAVFVQQPVPTFHYDAAKRPVNVRPEALGAYLNSAKGYARMAEMKAAGQLSEQGLLWLTELEPAEGNAYIDPVHYSPRFNKAIAEAITRHILDNALLP